MVLAETACLVTLPRRQLACGMAEVIKYGCIWDADLFKNLETHTSFEDLKKVINVNTADIIVEAV